MAKRQRIKSSNKVYAVWNNKVQQQIFLLNVKTTNNYGSISIDGNLNYKAGLLKVQISYIFNLRVELGRQP